MSVTTVTHLNFRGEARAALSFYQTVFGGDLALVNYPDDADQVMWGQVAADNGFRVMAYDVPAATAWSPGENAFFVSLRGQTTEEIIAYWKQLSDGATVLQSLEPSPWAPLYGMLRDRFGITWVVDVAAS